MIAIWKYVLTPGHTMISMPLGADVLSAHAQGDDVCIWARVDTTNAPPRLESRLFYSAATGEQIPVDVASSGKFIGTCLLDGGILVFHVFEVRS